MKKRENNKHGYIFIAFLVLLGAVMTIYMQGCIASKVVAGPDDYDLTVHFTAPGDDWDVGTASCYQARYTTDTINGPWVTIDCDVLPSPNPAGTPETIIIPDLPSGSHLFIQVRAGDELEVKEPFALPTRNFGMWSNILGFNTPDKIIPGQIVDLRVE